MTKQYRSFCTRQDLIRSAAEVIDQWGFAESSLNTISSRAGVSTGGLSFHFKNKQALGEALELAAAQALLSLTGAVPFRHPAPLQSVIDASQALVRSLTDDPVLRAGFGLSRDATWQGGVRLWEQWQDWVQLSLTVARDRGTLAADVALDEVVSAITVFVAGFEVLRGTGEEWRSRDAVTGFWRLMLPQISAEALLDELVPEGTAAGLRAADRCRIGDSRPTKVCGGA
ncbi:TetR/AcrR family transcriptional regulator [Streptomyces sp. SID3212]|uniref:TetR/AcrR family transcriptional regulator n=1 Tax=unclassified Streptomyces TaxID=2593676 RepID=UPI00136A93DF|nr:TetR/AcrR family transcriptional regulator [Streptomyces sp. SID3212]MYV56856.1 TetR family transcriptional regulator [Streptomyces sp. SID3212]